MKHITRLGKTLMAAVMILALLPWGQALAGSKKLMTIQKAENFARRAIVESTVGLKIRSETLAINDSVSSSEIQSKVAATIKGIEFDTPKYDKDKDIAMVTARIRLGSIENIIGRQVEYDDIVIRRVGFATSSPEYQPRLYALRAAELDAYNKMARRIVGEKVEGESKVSNFELKSDKVRTRVLAAIWGSEVVDFGWEEDGDHDAFVKLRMNVKWVKDVMGQRIQYTEDGYVSVTGSGTSVNDLQTSAASTGSSMSFTRKGPAVESVSFDIPSSGQKKAAPMAHDPAQPATGGSALTR